MKQYLLGIAVLMMGTAVMTGCSDDVEAPKTSLEPYSKGAYIVNGSSFGSSLTAIDFATNTATQNVFKAANNNEKLGANAMDGVISGSKMYLTVSGDNAIEVLDKNTLKRIKKISTTKLLGTEADGRSPRHIISSGDKVYFTLLNGYVAAIDTTNFELQNKWQVGEGSDGLAIFGHHLYVANSGDVDRVGSISSINLQSNKVTTKTIEGICWPQKIYCANDQLLVFGDGRDNSEETVSIELRHVDFAAGTSTKVCDASSVAMAYEATGVVLDPDAVVFYVLDRYGEHGASSLKKIRMRGTDEFVEDQSFHFDAKESYFWPSDVAVDPITLHVFVFSYNPDEAGSPSPGNSYVVECDKDGTKLRKYDTGVDPACMIFDAGYKQVTR